MAVVRTIVGLAVIAALIMFVLILTDLWKVSPRARANASKAATVAFLGLVFWFFVVLVS